MKKTFSRRSFLRGAGGVAVGLPYLPSIMGEAHAASAVSTRRMVLLYSPNGTVNMARGSVQDMWTPVGIGGAPATETSYDFKAGGILEPLKPHKSRVLVLNNLDLETARPWGSAVGGPNGDRFCEPGFGGYGPGDGHQAGMGALFSGSSLRRTSTTGDCRDQAGGPRHASIDQLLADRIFQGSLGAKPRFKSLAFGVCTGGAGDLISHMAWSNSGGVVTSVPNENDPRVMFAKLFSIPPTGAGALRARRQKVLDSVLENLREVKRDLSPSDLGRLDRHITSIEELENELLGIPLDEGPACTTPTLGTLPTATGWVNDFAHMPLISKLQLDLAVMAMACNLTRVITVQYAYASTTKVMSFLTQNPQSNHHSMSHGYETHWRALTEINRWYMSQYAYLIGRLSALDDVTPGTKLIDNTVLAMGSEISRGEDHNVTRLPFVLAGHGGFRSGRFVDCKKADGNAKHNALLVSLCHAMGATDITQVGLSEMGSGPLANFA